MKTDFIIPIYKYFAQFVSKEALRKSFVQPGGSRQPGYEEIMAEVLSAGDVRVINGIENYVFSINEKFLSDRIRNAKSFILYVEYGTISAAYNIAQGVRQHLAVTVAHEFSMTDNDNIQELALMDRCLNILQTIIQAMTEDQSSLEFCGSESLILDPVEIQVVDPALFYGRGGWCAIFRNAKTIMT